TENLERFDEVPGLLPLLKSGTVEEEIVAALDLARARRPGGRRHRQPGRRLPVEEASGDRALSGSRRAREDEQNAQGALALEVGEEGAPLVRAEAAEATVLADLELLHCAPGLHLPDARKGLEHRDHLELGDGVILLALLEQLAQRDRPCLQLLLQLSP